MLESAYHNVRGTGKGGLQGYFSEDSNDDGQNKDVDISIDGGSSLEEMSNIGSSRHQSKAGKSYNYKRRPSKLNISRKSSNKSKV